MNRQDRLKQAISLERDAHKLLAEQKIQQAFEAYDKAASFYRECGEHLKAALCFASAATCWNIHTGSQPLRNAATRSQYAAEEAMKAKNYDYARSLYREAAILYEQEGDGENYSLCFLGAQRADARHSWEILAHGRTAQSLGNILEVQLKDRLMAFFRWMLNRWSGLIWGYGERPSRTLFAACFVIVFCALLYDLSGKILVYQEPKPVNFFEAIYFSVVTFATVGYGDYLPSGWVRIVAVFEGLSGIFLAPLFLVALTRRYLRMYR